MNKVNSNRKLYKNNVFKWSEVKNSFFGALIVLIFSPISIPLGYKLNEYLSRPVLSIEYVFTNEVNTLNNLDTLENYFSKSTNYKNYKTKNYLHQATDLRNIIQFKNQLSCEELTKQIKMELYNYKNYLNELYAEINNKIKQINNATASELLILNISNFEDQVEANNTNLIKNKLRQKFSGILEEITIEKQSIIELDSTVKQSLESIQLKISILNKGSTDGLIRNEGFVFVDGKEYTISRIPPPQVKDIVNAIPTYVVNPGYETYYSKAVGRIEKNTMTEFWYNCEGKKDSAFNYDLCDQGSYEVVLVDQDNEKINKIVICKKL